MPTKMPSLEPALPEQRAELTDLAHSLISVSARTAGHAHPRVLDEIEGALRLINSYYSNLIEGHATHPVDIERAMRQDFSGDPGKRALQEESLAHVAVQRAVDEKLSTAPQTDIVDWAFVSWLHGSFYRQMPDSFRFVVDPDSGERYEVLPGELREREVVVGRHVAPRPEVLPRLMERFHEAYRLDRHPGGEAKLIAAAAAHHRLGWIHPFLDGNGRVMRLWSDTYLRAAGIEGHGLWSISRGLARNVTSYRDLLATADEPRRGDLDGRGSLTSAGLTGFCRFFLETCLDQAEYMSGILRLDTLAERLTGYVHQRNLGMLPAPEKGSRLDRESDRILHAVLLHGELRRRPAGQASGYAERKAGMVLKQLLSEGLLISDSPKGPVRLGFPAHVMPYVFPELVPITG